MTDEGISEAASENKRRGGRPPSSAAARARLAAETPEEAEQRRAKQRETMQRWLANNPDKYEARKKRARDATLARRADPEWQDGRRGANEPVGPLRRRITSTLANGFGLEDLTVLSAEVDPYRNDTGSGHREAAWFKEHFELATKDGPRRIHLRGLHYRLVARGDIKLPGCKDYINDSKCFFLLNKASRPARWLGYVDFDRIVDNRNEPPLILVPEDLEPRDGTPELASDEEVPSVPSALAMLPRLALVDSNLVQPYRIILIGEKSSLREELEPIARQIGAELILPSGEISDTLIHDFVGRAAIDGRNAVVIYFSDFDPAGNKCRSVVRAKSKRCAISNSLT